MVEIATTMIEKREWGVSVITERETTVYDEPRERLRECAWKYGKKDKSNAG